MDRIYSLITKAQNGDKISEETLIKENMPLVHTCVKRLMRDGYEYEDLLQLGSIGLIKAIRKFDTNYSTCLSTYAVPLIMGEIRRFLRDDGIIKVSRTYKEIRQKAMAAAEELSYKFGREATISEIASHICVDKEKLVIAMEACMSCESLQKPLNTEDGNSDTLENVLSDEKNSAVDELEKIALKEALFHLESKERKIIILRYFYDKTQADVSRIIGVSQVQISRIEKKLLANLKKSLE